MSLLSLWHLVVVSNVRVKSIWTHIGGGGISANDKKNLFGLCITHSFTNSSFITLFGRTFILLAPSNQKLVSPWNLLFHTISLSAITYNGGYEKDTASSGIISWYVIIQISIQKMKVKENLWLIKGQIMSECILWNYRFSKIPLKNLIDFCPGRLYRLDMMVWVNMYCI